MTAVFKVTKVVKKTILEVATYNNWTVINKESQEVRWIVSLKMATYALLICTSVGHTILASAHTPHSWLGAPCCLWFRWCACYAPEHFSLCVPIRRYTYTRHERESSFSKTITLRWALPFSSRTKLSSCLGSMYMCTAVAVHALG